MRSVRIGRSNTGIRRPCLCVSFALVLAVLGLAVLWSSSAPALTLPRLDAQPRATFAAGDYHSLSIATDGSLWASGWNMRGGAGDGTAEGRGSRGRIGTGTGGAPVAGGGE